LYVTVRGDQNMCLLRGRCSADHTWKAIPDFVFAAKVNQTKIDNCLSDIVELLPGVVQGSGIGPLMLIIIHTYISIPPLRILP